MGALSIATLDADLGYRIWVFGAFSPLSLGVAIHETTSPAPTPVVPLFLLGNAGVVPTLATLGPCLCTGVVVGLFPGGWVGFLGSLIPPFLTFVIALVGLEHAAIRGVAVKNPP